MNDFSQNASAFNCGLIAFEKLVVIGLLCICDCWHC